MASGRRLATSTQMEDLKILRSCRPMTKIAVSALHKEKIMIACNVRLLLVLTILLIYKPGVAATRLYISLDGENKIACYDVSEKGKVLHVSSVSTPGRPGVLCTSLDKKYLFAAIRPEGLLLTYRIEPDKLTLQHTVKADTDPCYFHIDHTGKYLLTAYYVAGKAAVHRINDDGSLTLHQWQVTDRNAHAIEVDPSRRWALVPHTGPNAIFQFAFSSESGKLTPASPPKVTTPVNTGPRHVAFHPNGKWVYADNEQGGSVTLFDFDKSTGQLTPRQTISTLPDDFKANNACARMTLSHSGRYLYAANRGHDSIAGFRIDQVTGELQSIGRFTTEKTPRSFAFLQDERRMIAAGQNSNRLACFSVDKQTGELTRYATVDVGKNPWWVLVVE